MAENQNTIIQLEPVYLNYGLDQIDLLAFLNKAASEVENYLSGQSWTEKRKNLFRKAYLDIMGRGVTGATNTSGVWEVTHNGDLIDLDSLSKKEREMYGEAAYFILLLMSGIPTRKIEEEKKEEEKKELPVFDNKYFTQNIGNYIGNQRFGGRQWTTEDDWNVLDERDSKTGLRGTSVRANLLADMLEGYSNSLKEGEHNFEGSPFKDLNDFKSRVNNAIQALRSGDPNLYNDALNSIGLNPKDWFYNGSADIYTDLLGNQMTYAQLAELLEAANLLKLQQEQLKLAQLQKANAGVLSLVQGIHGNEARNKSQEYETWLSETYGVGLQGFNEINTRVQALLKKGYKLNNLNSAEKKELGNLLYYIRKNNPNYLKSNISDLEWAELNKHLNLGSKNKDGFVRLPWQTSDGRYTYADDQGNVYFLKPLNQVKFEAPTFLRSAAYNNYKNNFLYNTNKGRTAAQQQYLNLEGAENAEIGAIIADIASIVNPEPFSAMGLSLGAAGARNYAKLLLPGKWSLGDYASLGLDYLTSIIGAVPVAGDAVLAGKVVKNLRRLARFGAWSDLYNSAPELKDITEKKIFGNGKMTKQDWRVIGTALRGLVSHGRLNLSNLAARTVMKQRGIEAGNAWHLRAGFTSSAPKETSTPTLKVTKNGKSEEIDITAKEKLDLEEAFKKAKPSERTAKAREILGNDKIPEGTEVKVSDGVRSTVRNWNRFTRRTSDSFGTKSTPTNRTATRSDEEFENFLKGRSTWNKIGLGSNRYLRRIDRQLNLNSNSVTSQNNNTNVNLNSVRTLEGPTPEQYRLSLVGRKLTVKNNEELPENIKLNRETMRNYKDMLNNNFSNNELQNGSSKLSGTPLQVVKLSDGTFSVIFKGSVVANERNLREIQKTIKNIIKNTVQLGKTNSNSKILAKEMGKLLKEFKAKGWLKHGGTIDKKRIQQYKEFINK